MALPAFSTSIAITAAQLLIVLSPVVVYGAVRRSKAILIASSLTVALCFMQSAILFTPSFGWLATLQYNWLQKALVLVCILVVTKLIHYEKGDCGFEMPKRPSALFIALCIGLVFALVDSISDTEHTSKQTFESIIFQLTMPGLQEEPLYRGLMLAVWDKCFGRPWTALGVQFGAGAFVTTVLFTVGHLVALDAELHVIFNPDPFGWINFVVFSLAMCWLR